MVNHHQKQNPNATEDLIRDPTLYGSCIWSNNVTTLRLKISYISMDVGIFAKRSNESSAVSSATDWRGTGGSRHKDNNEASVLDGWNPTNKIP